MTCRPWLRAACFAPCSISFRSQGESTALTYYLPCFPGTCHSWDKAREVIDWQALKMSHGCLSDAVESGSLALNWAKLVGPHVLFQPTGGIVGHNVMSGHYHPFTGKREYVGIIVKSPTISHPQMMSSGRKRLNLNSAINTLLYQLGDHRKSFNISTPPFHLL